MRGCLDVPLRIATLELTSEQVAEPSLEERDDTTEEEEPNAPSGSPETNTRTFTDRSGVEASVDLDGIESQAQLTRGRERNRILTTCFKSLHMRICLINLYL